MQWKSLILLLISSNESACNPPGLIPHISNVTVIGGLFQDEHLKKAASKRISPKDERAERYATVAHNLKNRFMSSWFAFFIGSSNGLYNSCCFDSCQIVWTCWRCFDVVKQHVFSPGPGPVLIWWGYKLASAACTEAAIQYQMDFKNWVSGLTARFVLKPVEKLRTGGVASNGDG